MSQAYLTRQAIESAIFEGIHPTKLIKIPPLTLVTVISDRALPPRNSEEWLNFFENALFIPGLSDSRIFLREVPFSFFERFVEEYTDFYQLWLVSVLMHMPKIIDCSRSRLAWQVYTKSPADKVIPIGERLNTAQYYWVAFNALKDKGEVVTTISDLFNALKPWLNWEMWKQSEEDTEARVNIFYDDQVRDFDRKRGVKSEETDVDEITLETK